MRMYLGRCREAGMLKLLWRSHQKNPVPRDRRHDRVFSGTPHRHRTGDEVSVLYKNNGLYWLHSPLTHSCTHSHIHSLTHSFIHALTHPCTHSHTQSLTHSLTLSFHSFAHALTPMRSLTHAFTHPYIHSPMHSLLTHHT